MTPRDAERRLRRIVCLGNDLEPVAHAAVRADDVGAEAAEEPQRRLGLLVPVGVELHASLLLEHARDAVAVVGGVQ